MPKRTDIQSIMIIGAGPIVIGQACEFDYSGAQACKALKEEGYRVILVNSNPATIMTDPGLADATYIEPITPEIVAKIIEKERPDALLPTMGGQTGLNTSLALEEMGVLEKFNVEMIGAKREAIEMAEDRKLFREAMDRLGIENPKATIVTAPVAASGKKDLAAGVQLALDALDYVGLPAIIRPAFTMGGTGGGVAYNRDDYEFYCRSGMDASPMGQILIDESLLGWKEFEMEVVRDTADNAIIVCSIENIDPMGVHTGDSITVAPALTLTDKEYQIMRNHSIAVLREIGVETGGSNVQWAVNPADGRMVVIEMNPRVSRSSALASKATGFPIAKIAAKLAVGFTLDELDNDITGVTPASFEPTIDYVVTKIPKFAFEKFPGSEPYLTTAMKSVGEAMAIGRTIHESLQKALASMESGLTGFDEVDIPGLDSDLPADAAQNEAALIAAISKQTPDRMRTIAQAMRHGMSDVDIHGVTMFDPWFLARIREIVDAEAEVRKDGLPLTEDGMRKLKMMGFTDARLGTLTGREEDNVRRARLNLGVKAVFKRIDTCAAEFEAQTPYMYSTYEAPAFGEVECEARPSDRKKVVILGGGPNRIGQGIEFDYCCCHACYALTDAGYETIMVNCNPETVSTDYDTSDRLYFEPVTFEHVMEILRVEQENGTLHGVIVQFGGQTPLKIAQALQEAGIPILGTTPDMIDLAEDRERFQQLVQSLGLKQPHNGIAHSDAEALEIAADIGFPLVIRPSYVLGGRAMEIVRDQASLERYIREAVVVSGKSPVLLDHYLSGAVELDVDALSDGTDVHVAGIMQHIEEAGVHSGDSACSLPPYSLSSEIIAEVEKQTKALALALNVVGLMNIQFAVKDGEIYLIEVNPRASRTVPFVAKATDSAIASIAARIMAGEKLSAFPLRAPYRDDAAYDDVLPLGDPMTLADPNMPWFSVKEAVLPFARFPGVDTLLGPEMRSTGEVMGWDRDFPRAFLKAQMGAGNPLPRSGCVFFSVKDMDKSEEMLTAARILLDQGFTLRATRGTAAWLTEHDIACEIVNKVYEGRPNITDMMKDDAIHLVLNTTEGTQAVEDSKSIRSIALYDKIPYFTTAAGAYAAALAIKAQAEDEIGVKSLQG
ncbi:MAG: carbamoyl-phosphate synthase large subunit [Sulfitobacter litoralis]|jgi:carbamoyl-phosphate synthase large subunit|uniref:Carbamoyl phosphate synthase large chain n=2 Tax=root TaxID=1 RepID=A0A1H0RZV0_9RHOB|nr:MULTISPECIES: carbamoyl-phosphate synthase large subunit [Sulfitobacter]MBQ0717752.1 carbamoyl-phosphate synthase large subunit [Sulfitobacter litoralis]MBQ0766827.1 carbamoyl-phosphate synthase large subunit [Sulfitobacter litoralis]MBQ0801814.1 carbamoyl-phosphate synthase large subunit [Sulfitobacter litoralis]MCF7725183.1 carbamoyl-phosphate synthase large subunit [Sulfitobacter sp. M22]MCF7776591.1 carbamoyl-phosphate synthase large subunit [Sulfitobacter sp. M220]|tara:strand:- start:2387 stop:5746 length:3360 start_codon:yes stop_codon:yes gene_type:complete